VSQPYQARLIIRRNGDNLSASWLDGEGQESLPFPLALPLNRDDARDLRWYLEEFVQFHGTGDLARARPIEARLDAWGKATFEALFGNREGAGVYHRLMEAARKQQPCLLTLGTTDPAVLAQPWELVRDAQGPLALQGVTIRRQLQGFRRGPGQESRLPLRVLLIVSRPVDTGFIDPRTSVRPVLEALEQLPAGALAVDFCDPPTFLRLEEIISEARDRQAPYHVVHFDGHGEYLPRTGVGALAFENEQGKTDLVPAGRLGDLLARLDVPLVLLEACRGADLSQRPVFGSLAPTLLQSGVGSVIAFSHTVLVQTALLFVERLYQKLAVGRTVGQALEEARSKLYFDRKRRLHPGPGAETPNLQDWFIPQLYQVGSDPALFAPALEQANASAEEREELVLPGFPPEPMYHFHGRARELLELERLFRKYPAVVLYGMGGMGKTALAREAAHWWVRTGRFETAVFCSFEQKQGAERVVQLLGYALEGDRFSSRPAEEQWQTAVKLFRRKRVLLVWDNFESTLPAFQQGELASEVTAFSSEARNELQRLYRELTSGEPNGRLLVTCRPEETLLPAIRKYELAGLAEPDSLPLLAAILDREGLTLEERPGYERAEVDELLKLLGHHPLSIELVTPHFKTLPPRQIREEFGQMLERFTNLGADEDRNKSLLASLEFSKKRLSEQSRLLLPYLAWFQGGVFEQFFLDFAELGAEAWEPIRAELAATALVDVEESIQVNNRPYLRFHPTLPYAAQSTEVPNPEAAQQRFLKVSGTIQQMTDKALRGQQPAQGMALLAREEANVRSAITLAFRLGLRHQGWHLADTLREYLGRASRLRERDELVGWVRGQMSQGEQLDEATCDSLRQHAWSLSEQGQAARAIQLVQGLLQKLQEQALSDPRFTTVQIAMSQGHLGRLYSHAGRPDLALEPLQQAVAGFEQLGEAQRGNLSAALGSLANAFSSLGRFGQALAAAERGVAIDRERGNQHALAAGLIQTAAILREQQRYAEADTLYDEAMQAARATGDVSLQGPILQHQGGLQRLQGHHDQAVQLFQQALALFQRAGDGEGEMQTCDLLGSAEMLRGQLKAAEAWYLRSRELAHKRNDRSHLGVVAQNLSLLYESQAEQATEATARIASLRQAVASVQESLAIRLDMNNQVGAASSYSQLGFLHRMLQEWDQAETCSRQAMQIRETLNHPDVWLDYGNLAVVAQGRHDEQAAAQWQAKAEAKYAEVQRLRRGEGSGVRPRLPERVVQALLELARACYTARTSRTPLPPDAAELLARLAEGQSPFPAVASFLQAVAAGQPLRPLPADLPKPLDEILGALNQAVQS
jgi:tetratricopeptide (TPR) repeat protein